MPQRLLGANKSQLPEKPSIDSSQLVDCLSLQHASLLLHRSIAQLS